VTDPDANDTIEITGLPAGSYLSNAHGDMFLGGQEQVLTPAQLVGLELHAPDDDSTTSVTLDVQAVATEGPQNNPTIAKSAIQSVTVNVVPNPEAPTLGVGTGAVSVNEGSSANVTITDVKSETDADTTLGTITVSNVPTGVTFNHGSAGGGGTWLLNPATDLSGLQVSVPDGDQGNFTLQVDAPATEGSLTATATQFINVTVNPVAEPPTLTASASVSGNEETPIALNITDTQSENDADATLGNVTISGVAAGASLDHGSIVATANDGSTTWSASPSDLGSLHLSGDGEVQNFALHVTAAVNDNGNIATSSTDIGVTVVPIADQPVLTAPDATADSGSVNQGGTDALFITPTYEADADAVNTVTITGLPAGAFLTDNGPDVFQGGHGPIVVTQAQLNGLTLHAPGSDSSSPIVLTIQAHAHEGATTADSATQTITISINPSAPVITSVNDNGDGTITVNGTAEANSIVAVEIDQKRQPVRNDAGRQQRHLDFHQRRVEQRERGTLDRGRHQQWADGPLGAEHDRGRDDGRRYALRRHHGLRLAGRPGRRRCLRRQQCGRHPHPGARHQQHGLLGCQLHAAGQHRYAQARRQRDRRHRQQRCRGRRALCEPERHQHADRQQRPRRVRRLQCRGSGLRPARVDRRDPGGDGLYARRQCPRRYHQADRFGHGSHWQSRRGERRPIRAPPAP
jgi:hypothetical protein